jgi:ketosteroid isomerase-like protein
MSMKEQGNVALIQKMYAAFAAGQVQSILNNVSPDAEWINHGPLTIPYSGSRKGLMQIREFFKAIADSTTGGKVTPKEFLVHGDMVVATGRYTATVRETGAPIDTPIVHLFTIRNGTVTRWEGFSDTAHVAEAHRVQAAAGR